MLLHSRTVVVHITSCHVKIRPVKEVAYLLSCQLRAPRRFSDRMLIGVKGRGFNNTELLMDPSSNSSCVAMFVFL